MSTLNFYLQQLTINQVKYLGCHDFGGLIIDQNIKNLTREIIDITKNDWDSQKYHGNSQKQLLKFKECTIKSTFSLPRRFP